MHGLGAPRSTRPRRHTRDAGRAPPPGRPCSVFARGDARLRRSKAGRPSRRAEPSPARHARLELLELAHEHRAEPHRRSRYDRCRSRAGREETDLAEDVARAQRPDDVAVSAHLGAAGLDHEPVVGILALHGERRARLDRDAAQRRRDRGTLAVGQVREERIHLVQPNPRDNLDPRILIGTQARRVEDAMEHGAAAPKAHVRVRGCVHGAAGRASVRPKRAAPRLRSFDPFAGRSADGVLDGRGPAHHFTECCG